MFKSNGSHQFGATVRGSWPGGVELLESIVQQEKDLRRQSRQRNLN
jgi:hypothetical protein